MEFRLYTSCVFKSNSQLYIVKPYDQGELVVSYK